MRPISDGQGLLRRCAKAWHDAAQVLARKAAKTTAKKAKTTTIKNGVQALANMNNKTLEELFEEPLAEPLPDWDHTGFDFRYRQ